jgi:polysaccharide export outer membrane protein
LDRTLDQAAVMTVRVDNVLAVVTLLAMQAACAGVRTVVDEPMEPQARPILASDVDSSAVARLARVHAEQTIVARDLLDVAVFEAPDLGRVVRVADDGMISLPLLGPIQAAGRTPRELEVALQDTLRRTYMRDPRVSVTVKEPAQRPIYVVGEVHQPGAYVAAGEDRLTVLRAVAVARGAKPSAAQGRAVILRPRADGEPLQIRVNLDDMVRGKAPDLVLVPNDIVYVPKNAQRAVVLGVVDALVRVVAVRRTF